MSERGFLPGLPYLCGCEDCMGHQWEQLTPLENARQYREQTLSRAEGGMIRGEGLTIMSVEVFKEGIDRYIKSLEGK